MKDRRLGLTVVGAAAITALLVAEPKVDETSVDEARAATTYVHIKGSSVEPCMAEDVMVAARPTEQPARDQVC